MKERGRHRIKGWGRGRGEGEMIINSLFSIKGKEGEKYYCLSSKHSGGPHTACFVTLL